MALSTVPVTYRLSSQQQTAYVRRIIKSFYISTGVALAVLVPSVGGIIAMTLPLAPAVGVVFGVTVLGFTMPLTYLLYRSLSRIHQHIAASIVVTVDEQGIRRELVEDDRPPIDGFNKVTYRNTKRTFNQTTQLTFQEIVGIAWNGDDLWIKTAQADPATAAGILHLPKELDQLEALEQLLRQKWAAAQSS